jgi:pimeloyl-ACP methyl ester carboxylesterase
MPPEPSIVITLVHGTNARQAPWTQSGSPFRANIETGLPGEIQFQIFNWSGRNSFRARDRASQELAKELDATAGRNPEAQLVVIGHSHGGNVALKALNRMNDESRVSGVACLSTPFLTIRDRNLGKKGKDLIGALPGVPIMVGYVLASMWFENYFEAHRKVALAGVLVAMLILVPVAGSIGEKLERSAERIAAAARIGLAGLKEGRLLIIRHTGDEASGILGTAMFTSWVISYVHARLNSAWVRVDERVGSVMDRIPRVLWLLPIVGVSWWLFSYLRAEWGLVASLSVAVLLGACFVTIGALGIKLGMLRETVLGASLLVMSPLLAVLGIVFGPEMLSISLFKEVTAEATPPGSWRVRLLTHQLDEEDPLSLVHSAAYSSKVASGHIVKWLKSVAE